MSKHAKPRTEWTVSIESPTVGKDKVTLFGQSSDATQAAIDAHTAREAFYGALNAATQLRKDSRAAVARTNADT